MMSAAPSPIRIAMWSGPRNLSTAMMRSFGSRADTHCIDEPFYAVYLSKTGLDHPMRSEVIASYSTDAAAVARDLSEGPAAAPVVYQKHMTHHMIDGVPRDWIGKVRNAFLIRHPARVLASYARKMEAVSLEAIGFVQQEELFELAADRLGEAPAVVDADDVLASPRRTLNALCGALKIPFDEAMLSWAPGPRPEDGVWAAHWYDAVWASTGFAEPSPGLPDVPEDLRGVLDRATPIYERLAAFKRA